MVHVLYFVCLSTKEMSTIQQSYRLLLKNVLHYGIEGVLDILTYMGLLGK